VTNPTSTSSSGNVSGPLSESLPRAPKCLVHPRERGFTYFQLL